jgi:hypothetical protein
MFDLVDDPVLKDFSFDAPSDEDGDWDLQIGSYGGGHCVDSSAGTPDSIRKITNLNDLVAYFPRNLPPLKRFNEYDTEFST